jgi:hypothetical protein
VLLIEASLGFTKPKVGLLDCCCYWGCAVCRLLGVMAPAIRALHLKFRQRGMQHASSWPAPRCRRPALAPQRAWLLSCSSCRRLTMLWLLSTSAS